MKTRRKYISLLLISIFLPIFGFNQIPDLQVQQIKQDMNRGNGLRETYEKTAINLLGAALAVMNNPIQDNMNKLLEARERNKAAAKKLTENRNKIINDVITTYGLTIPPGQSITYDVLCKGECVHGYCSIKCPIALCEKAFKPQPWGGGGTPGWIATIIKHELEHKKQINPGPPPSWTNSEAEGEYEAWQAALKCAEKSELTTVEKLKILEIKLYWLGVRIDDLQKKIQKLLETEFGKERKGCIPGCIVTTELMVKNYSDTPKQVNGIMSNDYNWEIIPPVVNLMVPPNTEMIIPVIIHIPDSAKIGGKNEIFYQIEFEDISYSIFTFCFVDPVVEVTTLEDIVIPRNEPIVPVEAMVENNPIGFADMFMIEFSNPLNWPVLPSTIPAFLNPGDIFMFGSIMDVPMGLPYWTTNLVSVRATSGAQPNQSDRDIFYVSFLENDIQPILVKSPLQNMESGTLLTPAVWAFNPGHVDSFFDVFLHINFDPPYDAVVTNVFLSPGQDALIEFDPIPLNQQGNFIATFMTQVPGGDADPDNDVIFADFSVLPPALVTFDNEVIDFDGCFEAMVIVVSNTTFEPGVNVVLVAGESIHFLPNTHIKENANVLATIDLNGQFCQNYISIIAIAKEEPEAGIKAEMIVMESFFSVYPNPNTGQFTLELSDVTEFSTIKVEIFSLVGESIMNFELPEMKQYLFELSARQPGIYLIRVMKGDEVGVEKVIKR